MGKISSYPVVNSMGSNDYFLIDTFPIQPNSTSIISKSNALSSALTNPMYTLGDIIYGGSSPAGGPTRLAGNTTSTKNFLTQTGTGSVSAAPAWGTISAGDVPTLNQNTTGNAATATAANGLASATTTVGVSAATAPTSGQVLTATSGTVAHWATPSTGFANPMTTNGDIIYGASAGSPTRLGAGSNSQVLTLSGGIPSWQTPSVNTATFYNVKTYGAAGNGAADDTSAIQSAINAALASTNGTGTVYFPTGTYKITSSLNCTSATISSGGLGVILFGDGQKGSRIFKNSSFGPAVTWNGNGGPSGNPTSYGGMIDISIEGNATTGGLLQTNSANQMFFRGCAFTGSSDFAWDLNTMQDSYFNQVTFNTNGTTTAPVIKIYGSSGGTSNMLWFSQVRIEDFVNGAINITRGAGASGGGNNGFFFSQVKIESAGRVNGDLFTADGYTQQLVMDQIFLSAGGFNGGYSTPANGILFGDGSTGVGNNQASFTNIFMHTGSGVANSVVKVNGASGMTGPVTIRNITQDGSMNTASVVVGSATNLIMDIQDIFGVGTQFSTDGTGKGTQLSYGQNLVNHAVTVTSNAGTCSAAFGLNTFTNSSAATMTITMSTTGAIDGQMMVVRVYDFSAAAETISWVNTENSGVSVPTTSNGSTTSPKIVTFMFNSATTKWRCVESV